MQEPDAAEFSARPRNTNKVVVLELEPRPLDAKAQLLQPRGPATSVPFLSCAVTGEG